MGRRRLLHRPAFRPARARERGDRAGDPLFAPRHPPPDGARPVSRGGVGVPVPRRGANAIGSSRAIRMLLHCAVLVPLVAPRVTTGEPAPSAPEKAVFASPAPGSAVGLLSEVIKENRLDERNGIRLDVKYFDPAATEQ